VCLCIAAPAIAVVALSAETPSERRYETVLLVEDEPANLRWTTRLLEREGYTALASTSPSEAIRLADEHPD
jgi:two-component system, cell cycle sensor histidine kinase and response regulator CckA